MSEHEQQEPLKDLPDVEAVDAESVRGGFNPQPDPPKVWGDPHVRQPDAALLLPAIQKVRDAANK